MLAESRAKVGEVQVVVDVEDAEVLVDGRSIGRSPLAETVFVEPGSRVVQAKAAGGRIAQESILATAGGRETVRLTLGAASAGAAPLATATSTTGPVEVPPPSGGPNTGVVIAGYGLAAAAAGAGIVFAIVSSGKASDAETRRSELEAAGGPTACGASGCSDIQDLRSERDTFANLSLGMFVGAGVLALATTGYLVLTPRRSPQTQGARVSPWVSPKSGGVSLGGKF
jgi:hypothetical protein